MTLTGSIARSILGVTAGLLLVAEVAAQSWAAAASGTWSNPASWNPATVPGASSSATITKTGTDYTVSVDGATAVGGLTLSSANATLGGPGPLTVGTSGLNWTAGTLATTLVTATVNLGTSPAGQVGTIAPTGTLRLTGGNTVTVYGQLTNAGLLDTGSSGSTIVVEQGNLILDTGSTMTGNALVRLQDSGRLTLNGSAPFTSVELSTLGGDGLG